MHSNFASTYLFIFPLHFSGEKTLNKVELSPEEFAGVVDLTHFHEEMQIVIDHLKDQLMQRVSLRTNLCEGVCSCDVILYVLCASKSLCTLTTVRGFVAVMSFCVYFVLASLSSH